jgi:hypothetical protein
MSTNLPDNPNEIRQLLTDVSRDVYNGLIVGSMRAREYFDTLGAPLNAPLAANLTRYHAKDFVSQRRSLGTPYLLKDVPNNGIAVRQTLFDIKVLKGRDDKPPSPSKSRRSELFYAQSLPTQGVLFPDMYRAWTSNDWPLFVANAQRLNLILCWEVDKNYSVTSLQLICPRQSWKYGQSVKIFWRTMIPNPAQGIVGIRDVNANEEDLEDLEIYFDEEEQGGEE